MRQSFKSMILGGAVLFGLSMCLTSCEDILGHWERPTNNAGGGGESGTGETSISLDKANLRFVKTDLTAQTLKATVTPSDASDPAVTWTSSDEAVATVANGVVTPIAPGEAIITAKAGDKTVTSTVYVYDKIYDLSSGWTTVTAGEFWLIEGTDLAGLTIDDNAKVTLNNINMNRPIGCNGDATIILADGSINMISAPSNEAGIKPGGSTKTLIIDAETAGTGKLMVYGGDNAAGIGTKYDTDCGNIEIKGGVITAQGGQYGAGIGSSTGSGSSGNCGKITISGGTIKAVGGANAAGIGGGKDKYCKDINITTGVTSVIAKKGPGGAISISTGGSSSTIMFGTATVFESSTWSPNPMVSDTYGGLNLVISTTNTADDTWTLTPAP